MPEGLSQSLEALTDRVNEAMACPALIVAVHVSPASRVKRAEPTTEAGGADASAAGTTKAADQKPAAGSGGEPGNLYFAENQKSQSSAGSLMAGIGVAVVLAVAIYVVCATLWGMEEGSDSIVYKMTASKLNKRD